MSFYLPSFLDAGTDLLCRSKNAPSVRGNQLAHFISLLFSPTVTDPEVRRTAPNGILVIFTAESMDVLHPMLRTKYVFGRTLDLEKLMNGDVRKVVSESASFVSCWLVN